MDSHSCVRLSETTGLSRVNPSDFWSIDIFFPAVNVAIESAMFEDPQLSSFEMFPQSVF